VKTFWAEVVLPNRYYIFLYIGLYIYIYIYIYIYVWTVRWPMGKEQWFCSVCIVWGVFILPKIWLQITLHVVCCISTSGVFLCSWYYCSDCSVCEKVPWTLLFYRFHFSISVNKCDWQKLNIFCLYCSFISVMYSWGSVLTRLHVGEQGFDSRRRKETCRLSIAFRNLFYQLTCSVLVLRG
jgi:hypothetical protein